MSRVSLDQSGALPDILDQIGFNIYFGNVPLSGGRSHNLTIACINAVLPGLGNESYEATLHGHTHKFRGRMTTARTMSISFYEVQTGEISQNLYGWNEFVVGTRSGNSQGYKADYSTTVTFDVLDTTGRVTRRHLIYGVFPQEVPDVTFDGSSSAAVQLSSTFNYDYVDWNVLGGGLL